jgi:hypothetical protein
MFYSRVDFIKFRAAIGKKIDTFFIFGWIHIPAFYFCNRKANLCSACGLATCNFGIVFEKIWIEAIEFLLLLLFFQSLNLCGFCLNYFVIFSSFFKVSALILCDFKLRSALKLKFIFYFLKGGFIIKSSPLPLIFQIDALVSFRHGKL